MFEKNLYIKADIGNHALAVKNKVIAFVEANIGKTEDEQRNNLPKLNKYLIDCVAYVEGNLPVDVDRVDGYVIEPILREVIAEKIAGLPVEESEEI